MKQTHQTKLIQKKNNLVRVFCFEKIKLPMIDLYIDKTYRRFGYVKFIIKYISTVFKKAQFEGEKAYSTRQNK